jgi:hypothetical protein
MVVDQVLPDRSGVTPAAIRLRNQLLIGQVVLGARDGVASVDTPADEMAGFVVASLGTAGASTRGRPGPRTSTPAVRM